MSTPSARPLTAADCIAKADRGEVVLLDVREGNEVQASGRAKAALHIPLGLLPLKADPKSPDFDARLQGKPIAVYCAAGARAGRAVQFLTSVGLQAENIGGFADWCAAGGPVEG